MLPTLSPALRSLPIPPVPLRAAEATAYGPAAGFPDVASQVAEGLEIRLPCRVTTKPSDDGRYVNVERVLPAEERPNGTRGRQ